MGVIKPYNKVPKDRAAGDRSRHKELVKENLKKGIADIISEEALIGQSGNKKIRIPIRGLKEYGFIYGSNSPDVAQGGKNLQRGQVVQKGKDEEQVPGNKPGDKPGEDIYETEISFDELIDLMFDDLELPDLEKKKFRQIEVEVYRKRHGYVVEGKRNRLDKKRSLINKKKRLLSQNKEDGSFIEDDLVYKRYTTKKIQHSNAVLCCVMDVSGSMDASKKYIAKAFYFLLYQFILTKYEHTKIVFITHHTEAQEVSEKDFFSKGGNGGTIVSSGLDLAQNIMDERYPYTTWNRYFFYAGDGENLDSDNKNCLDIIKQLSDTSNLFVYSEICPYTYDGYGYFNNLSSVLQPLEKEYSHFKCISISDKDQVWYNFKKIMQIEKYNEA